MNIRKIILGAPPSIILYTGMILSLVLSVGTSVVNTHILGVEEFGKFKYVQTYWTLATTLTTFGLYSTGSYLHTKEPLRLLPFRLGTLTLLSFLLSVLASFLTALTVSFTLSSGENAAGNVIILLCPLLVGLHVQVMLAELFRASGSAYSLAATTVAPQALYLCAIAFTENRSTEFLLAIYLLSVIASSLALVLIHKPRFKGTWLRTVEVARQNKSIGSKVYLSTILTTLSANLFSLLFGATGNYNELANLSLALTISAPLLLAPNAFANARFRDFSGQSKIQAREITAISSFAAITLLCYIIAIPIAVKILYPIGFSGVITLSIICGLGSTIHGIGDIFNRFLLSQGSTSALLRSSVILTAATLLIGTPVALVYGALGASITKTLIDLLYFTSMYLRYRSKSRELLN